MHFYSAHVPALVRPTPAKRERASIPQAAPDLVRFGGKAATDMAVRKPTRLQRAEREVEKVLTDINQKYTKKERWQGVWLSVKEDVKHTFLVKAGLIAGALMPFALLFPPISIILMLVPGTIFTSAFLFCTINAMAAYRDPDRIGHLKPKPISKTSTSLKQVT